MLFNSLSFLLFFPVVILFYHILPSKIRYFWLLICSYYFYMCWNPKHIVLLLFSTVVTYVGGLGIYYVPKLSLPENKQVFLKKFIVTVILVLNLSVLFFFKYFDFIWNNISILLKHMGIMVKDPGFDVMLPIGISFYIFQALSYIFDVYRGDIYAEKNFFRYALFVSFFPQLVAGPIERSRNLLKQLAMPAKPDYEKARHGFLIMLWGYVLKVVIADRLAILVDTVYGDYQSFPGVYLVVATVLFAFQIYCDFAGYSIIAIGASEILGVRLMENFDAPYLSRSVSEFWHRWHISLSTWFRDYLYIPMGGSRKGTLRKYFNLMITFAVSGLWHGAKWSYVTWGLINGFYQVIGDILKPVKQKLANLIKIDVALFCNKLLGIAITFILIDFSWIFFRADRFCDAVEIIKSIITVHNYWILFDGSLYNCGLDMKDLHVMTLCLVLLLSVDILKYKKVEVSKKIEQQSAWFRWMIYIGAILLILVLGIWGSDFDDSRFIYFQF